MQINSLIMRSIHFYHTSVKFGGKWSFEISRWWPNALLIRFWNIFCVSLTEKVFSTFPLTAVRNDCSLHRKRKHTDLTEELNSGMLLRRQKVATGLKWMLLGTSLKHTNIFQLKKKKWIHTYNRTHQKTNSKTRGENRHFSACWGKLFLNCIDSETRLFRREIRHVHVLTA